MILYMPDTPVAASIIVPTYREAANLSTLTRRVFAALEKAGMTGELIVVDDDSRDGTEEVVSSLRSDHDIRLIIRRDRRGLSSAVLDGFREARYDRLVVLDADLQHPPESIPALLEKLDSGECDFVVATDVIAANGMSGLPRTLRPACVSETRVVTTRAN